jgi:hypothetical protein
MIELKSIQKQKSFYTIVRLLYICALQVSQFFIITILARQNYIKSDIILPCVDRSLLNVSIYLIKSVNASNI